MKQPRWMRTLKVGHVLAGRTGQWRIVRDLSFRKNGDLYMVVFAIRRCSWTGRCYTCLSANDLVQNGYRRVAVRRRRLARPIDERIRRAIAQPTERPYVLTCCDVEGVP